MHDLVFTQPWARVAEKKEDRTSRHTKKELACAARQSVLSS